MRLTLSLRIHWRLEAVYTGGMFHHWDLPWGVHYSKCRLACGQKIKIGVLASSWSPCAVPGWVSPVRCWNCSLLSQLTSGRLILGYFWVVSLRLFRNLFLALKSLENRITSVYVKMRNKHADWLFVTPYKHCTQSEKLTQIAIGYGQGCSTVIGLPEHYIWVYSVYVFTEKTGCQLHFVVFLCLTGSANRFLFWTMNFPLNNEIFCQEHFSFSGSEYSSKSFIPMAVQLSKFQHQKTRCLQQIKAVFGGDIETLHTFT